MSESKTKSTKRNKRKHNYIPVIIILVIIVGIPLLILNYQVKRSGLSQKEVIHRLLRKSGQVEDRAVSLNDGVKSEKVDFLVPSQIGQSFSEPPLISHISVSYTHLTLPTIYSV